MYTPNSVPSLFICFLLVCVCRALEEGLRPKAWHNKVVSQQRPSHLDSFQLYIYIYIFEISKFYNIVDFATQQL